MHWQRRRCFGPRRAQAAIEFDVDILAQRGSTPYYQVLVLPNVYPPGNADLSFTTGRIATANDSFIESTSGSAWIPSSPNYYSLSDLMSALAQPWTLTLDQGLSSERDYSMSLDMGTAPADYAPPAISFPSFGQTIDTHTPTFTFSAPAESAFYATVYHFVGGSEVVDAQTTLPLGATSSAYGVTLASGPQYYFELTSSNSVLFSGSGFSVPLDSNNHFQTPWQSRVFGQADAITPFTVPEPNAIELAVAALMLSAGAGLWSKRRASVRG